MATVVIRSPWTQQPNALPKPSALANSLRVSTLLLPTSAGWADATGNLYRTGGTGTVITVATPDGLARTSNASIAWSDFLLDRGTLNPSDGYAWVMRGTLNSVLGNWGGIIARTANNATGQGWAWQRGWSDVLTVYHNAAEYSNSGTLSQFVDSKPHTFVGVWRKSEAVLELWVDGVLRWSQTGANAAPLYTAGQGQLKILSSRDTSTINGKVAMVGVFNRSLSQGEAQALSLRPWQLFRARRRVLYFDVGGGGAANLEGDAAAQATAQAALSVSVPLAGAGVAVASAAGALSLSLPLETAATATANANGALSITVPLNAAAVAQALASAGLTHGVPLDGSASANPDASASLDTSGSADLAGNASASPSASASLTLAVPLAGAALTVGNADGSLTHIVPLQASAASASLATGGLNVAVQLNAAALAQALASAGLSVVSAGLSGSASASADANATLTLRINLEAAAVGNAVASGALASAGLIVSGTPGYTITRSQRAWEITRSQRAWRIAN